MKDFIYRHKRGLAGLLLIAIVASPFAVKAESLAEAIDRLTRELTTLGTILAGGSLTAAEQTDVMDEIVRISGELTDLQNMPPDPITMEIIVDEPAEYTQAQFKDASGTLVVADFYFSGAAPTTTQGYIDETIERAASTFGLSTTTLASNYVAVNSFSGPEVFEPQSTTLTTTTGPSVTSTAAPGRTKVHHVMITGDAQDFDSRAVVVFAPEAGFPGYATSTYDYTFTTGIDEWDMLNRLPELNRLTLESLAADTGVYTRNLAASSTVSFDKFDNQFEVRYQYSPGGAGYDLSTMFGVYSIVEDVAVTAGDDIFRVTMESDQDEVLSLTLVPDSIYNNRWDYSLNFSIHGVTTETDSTNAADYDGIRDTLLEALVGIGQEFGVTDETVIDDLLPFMLNHTVEYEADYRNLYYYYNQNIVAAAESCHASEIEQDIETIAERYFASIYANQTAGNAAEITRLLAPIRYTNNDSWTWSRCTGVNNNFFQNI